MPRAARPKVNSESQKELNRVEEQFKAFDEQVQSLTMERMSAAPLEQKDDQTKMSQKEIKGTDAPYMKPIRSISCKDKPLEQYEAMRKRAWEYIKVIIENYEIIGEQVELWTKRFAGDNADFWKLPVNKPIYVPRLVADQLSKCKYHRLKMDQSQQTGADGMAQYYGSIVVDETKERLSAKAVGNSFTFMGV